MGGVNIFNIFSGAISFCRRAALACSIHRICGTCGSTPGMLQNTGEKQQNAAESNGKCGTCGRSAIEKTEKAENREGWLCQGWFWVTWSSGYPAIGGIARRGTRLDRRPRDLVNFDRRTNHFCIFIIGRSQSQSFRSASRKVIAFRVLPQMKERSCDKTGRDSDRNCNRIFRSCDKAY